MTCPLCQSPLWMTVDGRTAFNCHSLVDAATGEVIWPCFKAELKTREFSQVVAIPVCNGVMLRVTESNGQVWETPMILMRKVGA